MISKSPGQTSAVFDIIIRLGRVAEEEAWRVFNMGVGFVLLTAAERAGALVELAAAQGFQAGVIGTMQEGSQQRLVWRD